MKTLTEILLEQKDDERYVMIKKSINTLLDFVERWNKQDKEKEVANAAQLLEKLIGQ